MSGRMDYIEAALDALAVVMTDEQPLRIVLQRILTTVCFGWIDDRDPAPADFLALSDALERAVAAA